MTIITVSAQDIETWLHAPGFRLGSNQFTFSISTAQSIWPGYGAGSEPLNASYSYADAALATAFQTAIAVWDSIIAPDFTQVNDDASTRGEVRVAYTNTGSNLGYAYFGQPDVAPGGIAGDVWMSVDFKGSDWSVGTYNFEGLLHEIGHTLGLKHTFEAPAVPAAFDSTRYSIMSYTNSGVIWTFALSGLSLQAHGGVVAATTPMVLDIAAAQAIYGAEATTRTGSDTYTFTPWSPVIQTIYDAGGNDTIDASNFTLQTNIDLRPGAYSSLGQADAQAQIAFWAVQFPTFVNFIAQTINQTANLYTFTDNLGIALSTIIENAFGGAGNDSVLGNDVANELRGNDGNDTLEGGKGNDIVNGGAGTDTAVFSGNRSDYVVAVEGAGFRLTDQRVGGGDGSDFAAGIEVFRFADGDIAVGLLTINPVNHAPAVVNVVLDQTATEDTAWSFQVPANTFSDADGDTLSYVAALGNGGALPSWLTFASATRTFSGTLPLNFNGSLDLRVTASDAGLSASDIFRLTVTPVNDAPSLTASSIALGTIANVATNFTTSATDVDGDQLTYSPGSASHGIVTGGAGGQFTYTPSINYLGSDSFIVTASDGHGGTATATVNVQIAAIPNGSGLRLITVNGFAGSLGGSGTIFGSNGFQDITVPNQPVSLSLEGSFSRGGDVLRLPGNSASYSIMLSGSFAILTDGDTTVSIPIGTAGMPVMFADGARTLVFDTALGSARIGTETFASTALPITAAPDGSVLPTGIDANAAGRLIFVTGNEATFGGKATVFGTNGAEHVTFLSGAITLDGSFSRGGDVLTLIGTASSFKAYTAGSSLILSSSGGTASIPIGTAGLTLDFDGNDDRVLRFDTASGSIKIGDQVITATNAQSAVALDPPHSAVAPAPELMVAADHFVFA